MTTTYALAVELDVPYDDVKTLVDLLITLAGPEPVFVGYDENSHAKGHVFNLTPEAVFAIREGIRQAQANIGQ